jgi:hypothetical protein
VGRPADESRTLRNRRGDDASALDRAAVDQADPAGAALLVTVRMATYPTSSPAVFGVRRCRLKSTLVEGSEPTITPFGATFRAVNTGGAVPDEGTTVLGAVVDGLWEFEF